MESAKLPNRLACLSLLALLSSPAALLAQAPPANTAAKLQFNRDVRPILSDKCFGCHGPDAKNKGVPVRLDLEAEAKRELPSGRRAIVPGDPANSTLVQRIRSERKGLLMPPHYSGLTLTEQQLQTLEQWVRQGAEWQPHWSFTPVAPPALPTTSRAWGHNPIDRFVLARLEQEGLQPRPPATAETLLRRVTLDLTGLPPTPDERARFLADHQADPAGAYPRLVDRLLASPRFAERLAARWLDVARYADSNGYQYDGERVMWRWRDYVIESFHQNKPFDHFVREQLAGDLLPNPTLEQRMATGFNRNHRINTEDGIVPAEYAVEYVVDRVETVGAAFLGLTTGCARCHNHKYDPLTQKEFYQLYALFNNIPEFGRGSKYGNSYPTMPAPTAAQQAEAAQLRQKMAAVEKQLQALQPQLQTAQKAWEKQQAQQLANPAAWGPKSFADGYYSFDAETGPLRANGRFGAARRFTGNSDTGNSETGTKESSAQVIVDKQIGRYDITDPFTISAWVYGDGSLPQGTILSRGNSDSFKGKGFALHVLDGRLYFAITSIWADDGLRLQSKNKLQPNRWHHVAVTFDGSKLAVGTRLYLDGQPLETEVLLDTLYRPFVNAGAVYKADVHIGGGAGPENRFRGLLDELRLFRRPLPPEEVGLLAVGRTVAELAAKPAPRTPAEEQLLRLAFLESGAPEPARSLWAKLAELTDAERQLARQFPSVMVMQEMPSPRPTHLLQRGQYDKPGELVEPGLPAFLPAPAQPVRNRLDFANWLVAPQNPLLARVTVNRFWQMLWGTGLVKTTEDFGLQGEWPSHPELLDWLAADFVANRWNVKALFRTLVLSATYRQDSGAPAELWQKDPDNRLLARGPRVRLPAEVIRDSALLVSGLLTHQVGGPSVKPYQPDGLWAEVTMQDSAYIQAKGADLYRRSLYTFWKRTAAPPMMLNFDASGREVCSVRETRTNTPLQALNLMNDVTFVESARQVGARMLREAQTPEDRLARGFQIIFGRNPSDREKQIVRSSLQYHLDLFRTKPQAAQALLKQGDSPAADLPPDEAAAYLAVASLLLNTDEFVTKE